MWRNAVTPTMRMEVTALVLPQTAARRVAPGPSPAVGVGRDRGVFRQA